MKLEELKKKASELKSKLVVLYMAFKHPKTPWYAKVIIIVTISYALSPIDLIPDFIPVLGYLDDLFLIPLGITLAIKLIPKDVLEECEEKKNAAPEMKGKGIYAGIVIAGIWILIIYALVKKFIL